MFAVCTADRHFNYAEVGIPGLYGDSTIFKQSTLLKNIEEDKWLGSNTPSLRVENVCVRPYLLGDCAFNLDMYIMKTCSQTERKKHPMLQDWESMASNIRKPIECTFGIFKRKFGILETEVRLLHKYDFVRKCRACLILHNLSIDKRDDEDYDDEAYYGLNPPDHDFMTTEANVGKRMREALMYYCTSIKSSFSNCF